MLVKILNYLCNKKLITLATPVIKNGPRNEPKTTVFEGTRVKDKKNAPKMSSGLIIQNLRISI